MDKEKVKKIALGLAIIIIPGAGIAAGSYLIYKIIKAKKDKKKESEKL